MFALLLHVEFFIGNILDIFYTQRSMTLRHNILKHGVLREKRYFIKGNILRFFFIMHIICPLSAIVTFILIYNTFIIFYRYFIIQSLYDFDIGISATIKIIQFLAIFT